jgi:hypothetical protein
MVFKKNIILVFLVVLSNFIQAQNSLQFNQVILLNSVSTVPAGKVWKIESVVNGSNPNPSLCYTCNIGIQDCAMSIIINSTHICLSKYHENIIGTSLANSAAASESAYNPTSFPIWLPAGSTVALGKNSVFISILEFNAP